MVSYVITTIVLLVVIIVTTLHANISFSVQN